MRVTFPSELNLCLFGKNLIYTWYSQAKVETLKLCVCVCVFMIYFNNLEGNNV